MKTSIRIQESSHNGFNFMTIQILTYRFGNEMKGHIQTIIPIGYIKFQQTQGEERWYAMTYHIETDTVEYISMMAKLAKHIQKTRSNYDAQPDEIIKIIGGVEHRIFNHEFISVEDDGKNIYDVFMGKHSLYTRVIALNETAAEKIINKLGRKNLTLKFNQKIVF